MTISTPNFTIRKKKMQKMQMSQVPSKNKPYSNRLTNFMILSSLICITYLITSFLIIPKTISTHFSTPLQTPTTLEHIVFAIASNEKSWSTRKSYVALWWGPQMRGCIFLEKTPPPDEALLLNRNESSLPPICISEDTARFRYTYRNGLRSAIRVARVVSEIVSLNYSNVRWFVFGDDDTVFFPENVAKTLSKYDHGLWYYVGANSESFAQNKLFSYEMAFGGGGFAISYPLAKVLARVFDSCLERYAHLYGSDSRIQACLAELGVGLTHEPGFHQMDIRGNMFGLLASHPLKPLVSLHHWEATDPIFPKMTPVKAIEHLFEAVKFDSQRIMQQTVCYDRWFSWTISVSWGYAVQIFPRHVFLSDALRTQETFFPWKKGGGINDLYNIDSLGYDRNFPCRRPIVFFFDNVSVGGGGVIISNYLTMTDENCTSDNMASPRKIGEIRVFSRKQELDTKQLLAPRRQCCDVLPSSSGSVMEIAVRECGDEELIYMH